MVHQLTLYFAKKYLPRGIVGVGEDFLASSEERGIGIAGGVTNKTTRSPTPACGGRRCWRGGWKYESVTRTVWVEEVFDRSIGGSTDGEEEER